MVDLKNTLFVFFFPKEMKCTKNITVSEYEEILLKEKAYFTDCIL